MDSDFLLFFLILAFAHLAPAADIALAHVKDLLKEGG